MRPTASVTERVRSLWQGPSRAKARLRRELNRVSTLTPERYGLAYEPLRLRTQDGVELAAWWVPGARRDLAMVLHHHFGGQRATLLPWIRLAHELGLSVLALDGRGHGESRYEPRGRESFAARAHDMRAACEEATRRGASELVVLGQSQGAIPALLVASERADVGAVIVDCGPSPSAFHAAWGLAGVLLERSRTSSHKSVRALFALGLLTQSKPLYDTALLWRALIRLRERPLLWVHGDADTTTPRAQAALWFRAVARAGGPWRALAVRGGDHVRSVQVAEAEVRAAVEALLASRQSPTESQRAGH